MAQPAWIYWNPSPDAFIIPFFNHPVRWYGLLFASGFLIGFWLLVKMLREVLPQKTEEERRHFADQFTWAVMLGTVIGARLGHVFFYDWHYYQLYPLDIFKVWEGGLASHGGVIGILVSVYLFSIWQKKRGFSLSFLALVDLLAPLTALAGCLIRIGNFVNQELVGTPSTMPWAVLFANPVERVTLIPRHPVQLYEALSYLLLFFLLFFLWKKKRTHIKEGSLTALFFVVLFSFRFFLEFFKAEQTSSLNFMEDTFLQPGQLLSLPCIIGGALLFLFLNYKKKQRIV